MGILSWIILGLIAGFIGSKIVNRQGQGFWVDILLGVIGAVAPHGSGSCAMGNVKLMAQSRGRLAGTRPAAVLI